MQIHPDNIHIDRRGTPVLDDVTMSVIKRINDPELDQRVYSANPTNPGCNNTSNCGGSSNSNGCSNHGDCKKSANSGGCTNWDTCSIYQDPQ